MKRTVQGFLVLLIVFSIFGTLGKLRTIDSAPSTSVKDITSNSQLSYFARLAVGVSTGDSIVKINTAGTDPSKTTSNLFVGDTVSIGNTNGGSDKYVVKDIGNTASIELTTAIAANNAYATHYVIATHSAIHTVSFTPTSSVMGGIWQVLIKATNRANENPSDGIPDQGGFDLGSTIPSGPTTGLGTRLQAADVTCPWGATAGVGTTVVLSSGVGVGATGPYHVITCTLAAGTSNPVGSSGTITIGRALTTGSQLINPAPAVGHTEGRADNTADTYNFYIRHLYNDGTLIDTDTSAGKIAVVESVRVTATVDPTITFYLDNNSVGAGASRCGSPLSNGANNTTATTINFGPLNLAAFNDTAHRFSCTTNAKNGYVVSVFEDGPLTNLNTGATIPNTNCDGACNTTTAAVWTTDKGNTISEFGYSLEAISGSPVTFTNATGYKAFGIGNGNAQPIMSRATTPTATDQGYICYRVTASNYQEAGNYENSVTFLATATF